jgi:replication-associated recombination protein RarA
MTSLTAKYQPSTLQGFVGLDEPKAVLAAVAREPYSSAFMFLGNPGTGKTTAGLGFRAPLTAQVPQADVADLPLFGGAERQQDLFE